MSREMIVGGEHIVGAHRDYDELMEMGADPTPAHAAPHPHALHPHHPHHARHPQHPHHEHEAPPPPPHHERGQPVAYRPRGGMRIVSEEPTHERQFPIGFQFDNVAPGAEEDIEVKPQVYFRGERLAIAQSTARYFDVLDIKVGKDSQLAATGALTGEAFETRAVGVRMELDTAKPGIVITLRVRNIDTAAHDFKAVLYGSVIE
jgi:hypothetical protein